MGGQYISVDISPWAVAISHISTEMSSHVAYANNLSLGKVSCHGSEKRRRVGGYQSALWVAVRNAAIEATEVIGLIVFF